MSQSNSVSHLDQLPTEVLLSIFDYLDGKSLKRCCQASKRMSEAIGESTNCMKKIPLLISSFRYKEEEIVFTRKYQSLIIDLFKERMTPILSCDSLQYIQMLEISESSIHRSDFKELLRELHSIQQISIIKSHFKFTDEAEISLQEPNVHQVEMQSLRNFTLIQSDYDFLFCIGNNKIQELKLANLYSKFDDKKFKVFLKHSCSLQKLALDDRLNAYGIAERIGFCFNNDDMECNFKFKKISLSGSNNLGMNFTEILEQHKETLEYLEVDCKLTENMYEFIFKNLKLKSLKIDGQHLPTTALFYNAIAPNIYLKKLVVTTFFKCQIQTEGLFRIFVNIQDLAVLKWSQSNEGFLISIANNLRNLKTLKLPSLPSIPVRIQMPSLHAIHLKEVHSAAVYQNFITLQANIRHLSVEFFNKDQELTYHNMNGITSSLPHLESITFGYKFNLTHRMLEMMKNNSPKLHTIQLFRLNDSIPSLPVFLMQSIPRVIYFTNKTVKYVFKDDEDDMWTHEMKNLISLRFNESPIYCFERSPIYYERSSESSD